MTKVMSMIRILLVGIGIIVFLAMWCILQTQKAKVVYVQVPKSPTFEDLLDAIEYVESGGDPKAVGDNGNAVGSFQIWKIYVDDVNRIGRINHKDKYSNPTQWKYHHRESQVCSRWIVRDYLKHYATKKRIGREPTFEDMARIHNGGPNGWKKESTKSYWEKVKRAIEGE